MKPKLPDPLLMQIEKEGLPMPDTEARFHPTRKWRCDYLWRWRKLVVEKEGMFGKFGHVGGHRSVKGFLDNMEKYNELAFHGYYLLRYTPQQVKNGEAIQGIKRFLLNNGK